ncbi:polysaccharide biosynthesis tyrosine autokinase [Frigoribacterium sp. VKM Ac-2836]|uniref:polysaccharide biosynthesis tyrosine autokinase n=1 Tax=Frigoribacterium sp. VKM Ac-2836 TaxID=2739014 RepID=UPI001566EB6F|nr:polysaccharide biosynthesis tyrosine autokinase [Frigoribacterium sp. VKM Ac-2836]
MELRDYIRILRKGWILIVAVMLVGVAAGALASILATPRYVSSTQLFVSVQSSESSSTSDLVQGSSAAQQKVRSYVSVVTSKSVLEPVIADLGLDMSTDELASEITAESPSNTVLVDITVEDGDAARAAALANAVGESFANVVVNDLESPEGGGPSLVKIATIEPAAAASAPSSPRTTLNLALGFLIGLALGVGAAVLKSTLDTRIHGSHDVELVTSAPILGGISFDPGAKKRPLIVHADPRSPRAESFRSLRTNLQFVNLESTSRCFVLTSSLPGEGKTTTTANLAVALAETGASVVVVDGDLRLPRLADTMGLEGVVGLTDVLIGRADIQDVLQPWGRGTMYVLPAGRIPPNPSELLGSKAMVSLIASLTESFDYVLIDAPPLLPVTDAAILAKLTGGAIVIAAAGRTSRNELQSALRTLEHIGGRVLGVVMTMLPTKGPDAYGYGNYGAYYGMDQDKIDGPDALPSADAKTKVRSR